MQGFFDFKSPNFLGGNNVHHVVIIGLLTAVTIGVFTKK
jgi:hypothetical protein